MIERHLKGTPRRPIYRIRLGAVTALATALISFPAVCSAAIYKCQSSDGSTSFMDTPCGPNTQVPPAPGKAIAPIPVATPVVPASPMAAGALPRASAAGAGHSEVMNVEQRAEYEGTHGSIDSAHQLYQEEVDLARRLADKDPSNTAAQNDLAFSYRQLGNSFVFKGDVASALNYYQASAGIGRKLVAIDPTNAEWQNTLALATKKIGGVQRVQSNFTPSLKGFLEELAARKKLAEAEPGSLQRQRDLAQAYERVADAYLMTGDRAAYKQNLDAAKEVEDRWKAAHPAEGR